MNIAIILAGGKGTRLSSDTPKQYILVKDKPILIYCLEQFQKSKSVDYILVVADKSYFNQIDQWMKDYSITKEHSFCEGGKTRQESSYNAIKYLKSLNTNDDDIILIHDAARALVSPKIIESNILECSRFDAINTAIPLVDSIFNSKDNTTITKSLSRESIYISQTPQTFKFSLIEKAHESSKEKPVTDDCQLVINYGHKVHLVPGSKLNFKITTEEDLSLFNAIINN